MTKSTNVWIGLLSLLVWGCGAEEGTSVDSAPEASVPVPGVPETVPGPTVEGTPVESETTEEEPSERTPAEPGEEAAVYDVEVEVAYTGAAEGDLIVTLFDVWPAVAPPQHFAFVPGGGFPAVATIEGVAEGTWTLVAVLDAEPKNPASQGPEDRLGLIEITVPSEGPVSVVISDEAVVEEEETTPTPQPEVEQPVPGGDLAFERFTVESNGYGPAFADLIDINDDGKLDIVVAQFGQVTGFSLPNGRVTVYLQGNSRTDWTPWEVVSESEGLIWPNDVTAEDIDGDGDLDLWVPAGFLVCGAVPLTSPCGALAWFEQNGNEWIRHDIIPNGDALFYHKP